MTYRRDLIGLLATCVFSCCSASANAGALEAGDIVLVQQSEGRVYSVDPVSGAFDLITDSDFLGGVSQVAFEPSGDILTATRGSFGIARVFPETGHVESAAAAPFIVDPFTLAFDLNGDLLVGDLENGLVRTDLDSGNQEIITSYNDIQDIEVASDGTIFLLDFGFFPVGRGRVLTVDRITGTVSTLAEDGFLGNPGDMTIGPNGNLLISNRADTGSGIVRVDRTTGNQEMLFAIPTSGFLSLEDSEHLILGNFGNNEVVRAELATGNLEVLSDIGFNGNITGIRVFVPEPSAVSLLAVGWLLAARSATSRSASRVRH